MLLSSLPKVYWINLDRAEARRQRMQALFDTYHIQNQRVPAFDGKDRSLLGAVYLPDYRTSLLAQCCILSHLKAIETFYLSEEEVCLIMEDDVSFEFIQQANFTFASLLAKVPADWEILQLSYTLVHPSTTNDIQNATTLFIPRTPKIYSAVCYAINRKGAKKVLDELWKPFPIDLSLSNTDPYSDILIFEKVKVYTCKFALFTYPTENDSFINPQFLDMHRRSKEFSAEIWKDNIEKYL